MRFFGALALLAAALLCGATADEATAGIAAPAPIDTRIANALDAGLRALAGAKTQALSVAIVENGKIAYANAFGESDVATHVPAAPSTRFRIGSVTKMFTAIAIMQLIEAKRVSLDDRLATYVPDAPHASEITIRELLMHTSGLRNYGDDVIAEGRAQEPTDPHAILAFAAAHPLTSPPGTKFAYSNTGYVALGLVVEAVTHRSLAEYEAARIFRPAGMADTSVGTPAPGAPLAAGYESAGGAEAPPYLPSWFYADGDVVSTAPDLARFDAALMSGKLVSPATFRLMQSSSIDAPELGAHVRYGLGLMLVTVGGATFVGHHGGVPGFEAENEMLPERDFAIVALSNAYDFHTSAANAVMLRETLPSILANASDSAPNPALSADYSASEKLRGFIASVERGSVDRTTLTPTLDAALTADVIGKLGAQFAALGEVKSLVATSVTGMGASTVYDYTATFANGRSLPLRFTLDASGKIAGIFEH